MARPAPDRLTGGRSPLPQQRGILRVSPPTRPTDFLVSAPATATSGGHSRLQRDGLPCPHRARAQTDPHLKAQGPLDRLTLVTSLPPWDRQSLLLMEGTESAPFPSEAGFFLSPATGGQALPLPSTHRGTVPHLQDRLSALPLQTQTRGQARRQQGPHS